MEKVNSRYRAQDHSFVLIILDSVICERTPEIFPIRLSVPLSQVSGFGLIPVQARCNGRQ
jgi:hypothetical protein